MRHKRNQILVSPPGDQSSLKKPFLLRISESKEKNKQINCSKKLMHRFVF
jgi:hypothetical protein